MALPISTTLSASEALRIYKKFVPAAPPALFHIHVDAKEALPQILIEQLLRLGFVRDDFHISSTLEPLPANAVAPINHLTWKGNSAAAFHDTWLKTDRSLLEHRVCAYTEGELIALDVALDEQIPSDFDELAYDRLCPLSSRAPENWRWLHSFDSPVLDRSGAIVGYEKRLLPIWTERRRLEPTGEVQPHRAPRDTGARELFRVAEVHLTLRRNGMDPRLLAFLTAMGLTDPIIPKLVVDASGVPILDAEQNPIIVEDMPMTLQAAAEPATLIGFFDALIKRVLREIGGAGGAEIPNLERTSVKYEPAPLFGLYNGRNPDGSLRRAFDPRVDEPLVLESIHDARHGQLSLEQLRTLWGADANSLGGAKIRIDPELLPERPAGFWLQLFRDSEWMQHWSLEQVERRRSSHVRSTTTATTHAAARLLEQLPAEHGLNAVARERRTCLAYRMTASVEPEAAQRYGVHLITQCERARVRPEWCEQARRDLALGARSALEKCLRLNEYPWQRAEFEHWSDREPASRGARLMEFAPGRLDKLSRYVPDARPVVFFFSGNRQAYTGLEHELASRVYGQDLQALAESYVARCGSAVLQMLAETALRDAKLVMPVYGALRSRHEQRLIHFALKHDPNFIHPSIVEPAEALFRALFRQGDPHLTRAPHFRAVTHSYGSSALVQCLNYLRRRARDAGISQAALSRYFRAGVCIQFGGYRLLDLTTDLAPVYHCVLSPLDEIALGSDGAEPRYTSPVTWPNAIWSEFSREGLAHLVSGQFERVSVASLTVKAGVRLWCPALEGFRAYAAGGEPVAPLESANGHYLSAYTTVAASRVPELLRSFSAN